MFSNARMENEPAGQSARGGKLKKRAMGKHVLSMALAVAMLFGLLPIMESPVSAATAITNSITLANNGSYTLSANMTGKKITVPNGVKATLTVSGNVTIDNRNGGGSPITIASGGWLVLKIPSGSRLTVYGQHGTNGASAPSSTKLAGGNGGFAGINVPKGATLELWGSVTAYGGNAGAGGDSTGAWAGTDPNLMSSGGSGGGGGAGAGIGGNGGNGGDGGYGPNHLIAVPTVTAAQNGDNGQDAGTIYFFGGSSYAYGGAGGSGGSVVGGDHPGGAGGGGYPGAGVGGGGAGAGGGGVGNTGGSLQTQGIVTTKTAGGGGGFSGGAGSGRSGAPSAGGVNGAGGTGGNNADNWFYSQKYGGGGGGYFSAGTAVKKADWTNNLGYDSNGIAAGATASGGPNGYGGKQYGEGGGVFSGRTSGTVLDRGGNGGKGGAGATVYFNKTENGDISVVPYNGSKITTAGTTTSASNTFKIRSQSDALGYGTGAGYTESGNGSKAWVTKPEAFTTTVASNLNSGELVVSWKTPSNGNQPISKVDILNAADQPVATFSGATLTSAMTTAGQSNSYTIKNLTNGVSYTYKVRITNYVGSTVAQGAAIPYTRVSVPGNVSVASNGRDGELDVRWTTPANNGSPITKIEIINTRNNNNVRKTISATSNQSEFTTAMTTAGQTASTTIKGLTGGRVYGIAVRITNAAGSTTSVSVDAVPAGPPTQTTDVTAKGTGTSGQIKVTWTTPANNGAPITSFDIINGATNAVLKNITAATDPLFWTDQVTNQGTSCTYFLTGMPNGTTYQIKVRANNSAGSGQMSGTASAYAYTKPGAPTDVKVTAGTKSLTVSWTAPSNGGSAITKYEVFEVINGTVGTAPVATTTGATSAVISNLTNAAEHNYVVRAVNEAGAGPNSGSAAGTTNAVPGAPENLTVTATSTSSVTASWVAPENDGGTAINGYVVTGTPVAGSVGNSGNTGTKVSLNFALADLTYDTVTGRYTANVTGLAKGITYSWTVRAVNDAVDSEHQGAESAARECGTFDQPAKVSISVTRPTEVGNRPVSGTIHVSWNVPGNGGSPITGYRVYVYRSKEGGTEIGDLITSAGIGGRVDADKTSMTIGNLTNGETYYFRVTAINAYGESLLSDARAGVPAYVPGPPSEVKATVNGLDKQTDTLLATWGYASPNGSDIVGYKVRVYDAYKNCLTEGAPQTADDSDIYTLANGSTIKITYTDRSQGDVRMGHSARITGLTPGMQYIIGVSASNNFGEDIEYGSAYSTATSTLDHPTAPTNLSVMPTGQSGLFAIDWSAPERTGAAEILRYQIFMYKKTYEGSELTPEKLIEQEQKETGVVPGSQQETVRIQTKTIEELQEKFPDGDYTRWVTESAVYTADNIEWVVRVRAENKIGWGTWTDGRPVAPYGAPFAVTDAETEIQQGAQSLKLTWTDPDNDPATGARGDGGNVITAYAVHFYRKNGTEWTDITAEVTTDGATLYTGDQEDARKGALIVQRVGTPSTEVPAGTAVEQTLTISGLEQGKTYRADVRAINEAGASTAAGYSDTVTMWTLPGPGAYTTVTPTNVSGELRIDWYRSRDDGDSASNSEKNHTDILQYNIYYRIAGNEMFSGPIAVDCREVTPENGIYRHVLTKLSDGEEYEIYVTAVNGAGETPHEKGEVTLTKGTPRRPADAPTIGTLKSGNASAVLKYIDQPGNDGGSKVTGYRIYAQEINRTDGSLIGDPMLVRTVNAVDSRMEDITIPDLVNGSRYQITVCAVNGTDLDGNPSNVAEVLVGLPEAPTNLKVEPGARFSAVAEFDAANGNGSGILGYYAYVDNRLVTDPDNMQQGKLFPTIEGLRQSLTVDTEDGGNAIGIQVSAVNRVGESARTPSVYVTIGTPKTPELSSVIVTAQGAALTWTESVGNGVRMTGYKVYLSGGDYSNWVCVAQLNADGRSAMLPRELPGEDYLVSGAYRGLKAGTEYRVCVRAENLVGESQRSNIMTFRFGVPGAPEVQDVTFGSSELVVAFKEPADKGLSQGSEPAKLKEFVVYANGLEKQRFTPEQAQAAEESDSAAYWYDAESGLYYARLTNLANGSAYRVQVAATNQYGEGPKSEGKDGTPATLADAPRNFLAEPVSDTAMKLSWRAPLYNGGGQITEYIVKVYDGRSKNIVPTANVSYDGLTAEVTGLTAATEYYFTVQAVNKAAPEGGNAATSEPVKTFGRPGEPQNVAFRSYKDPSTGKYNLEVTWDAPADNGGTPITGYKIWIGASLRSGTGMLSADTNSFTITGLNATSYTLRVEAFNSVCNDKASIYGGGTYAQTPVLVGKIAAPENLKATTTADSITLTWDPVEDDFAYYKVYQLDVVMSQRNCTLQEALDYVESQWQGAVVGPTPSKGEESTVFDNADPGTHYYSVKCFTNQGTGGYMSQVVEITLGGANAPTLERVVPGFETLDVSFRALTTEEDLNHNELYGYQLLINDMPYTGTVTMAGRTLSMDESMGVINDPALQTATGSVTLQLPDMEGDQTYRVTVRAMTVKRDLSLETAMYLPGQSAAPVRATVWTTPAAPTITDARGGDGEFTLHFRGTNSDGMGLPIAGYAVFYETSAGTLEAIKHVPVQELEMNNLSITVTGIENGYQDDANKTPYQYYVATYTESGGERWYSEAPEELPTIVTGIPGAPEITNTVAGNGTVTVYYSTPPMAPSLAVTSFIVTWQAEGTAAKTATVSSNHYEITGLENGKIYTVTVQAVNGIGEGQASEPATVRPGTPGAPEILDYASGDRQITVRWRAPSANGPAIQSYRVYYEDSRDGSRYVENVDVNLANINLTGLTNGVDYHIEIVAVNANGEGQPSQTLKLMPGTLPGGPTEVKATVISGSQIRLSWGAPLSDGGLEIDQYRITGNDGVSMVVDASDEANFTVETDDSGNEVRRYSVVVENLHSGKAYQLGVQAHNKRDYGEIAEAEEVTTFTVPGTPEWKGMSSMNWSFTAMWAPPAEDGGSAVVGYNVYLNGEKLNEEPLSIENGALFLDERGVISYTSDTPNLVLGATYEVSIAAVNAVGEGKQTSGMYVIIQGQAAESVPGRAGTPELTSGNRQLTVTWTAPLIEGVVEGVEGYYVCYREAVEEGENTNQVTEIWHTGTELKEVITGLRNGVDYDVWVVARNRVGRGAISTIVKGRPEQITAPPKPENMAYQNNAQMTTMTISWDPVVTSPQGGTVTYDVYINNLDAPVKEGTGITGTSILYPTENGVRYKIWVVARNKGGASEMNADVPHLIARNWLNVETTGVINAKPNLNLDRDFDGELDEDQIATKPTAPTGLSATPTGLTKIDLTWETPVHETHDGSKGEPYTDIEFYNVFVNGVLYQRVESSSVNAVVFQEDLTDGTKGLRPGAIYSFQVSAINGEGEGNTSAPLQILVQDSIDPTNLRAELGDGAEKYTTVHLAWNKPNSATGRVPSRYWIQINGADDIHLETEGQEIATEYTWKGAKPNTNYVFRVWAQYGDGEAAENSRTTNAVNLSTVLETPAAPADLTAELSGPGEITLNWTPAQGEFTGYYLYVDNQRQDEIIPADATSFVYETAAEADFTFSISAVNIVDENNSKESAHSNVAAASTRELAEGAPAAPQNLAVSGMNLAAHQITLTWDAVSLTTDGSELKLEAGQSLTYKVYVSRSNSALEEVESTADDFNIGASSVTYTYTDLENQSRVDYVFRVCAVISGDTDIRGEMSTPLSVSTKEDIPLPARPVNLRASVSADKNTIVLTWDPVEDAHLLGYAVFLDAAPEPIAKLLISNGDCDPTAPAYTYTIPEGSKSAFYFQIAAINSSEDENSTGHAGMSELSDGRSVSLSGGDDPIITDLPAAADAPSIERSVHNEIQKVIRVYWKAPTQDIEGKPLDSAEIAGYQINIAPLNEDGTTGTSYMLERQYRDTAGFDEAEGLWHYDIAIENEAYPIREGVKYAVTITAWRSFMVDEETSSEVPGAGQTPWIVMQNLNLDTNDDWVVDKFPDSSGSGSEDVVAGALVTVTATITAGGNAKVEPTVTITDSTGETLEVTVTYNAETGALVAEFRVQPAESITYNIRITKPGCTWFELQNVPTQDVSRIDLNAISGSGKITLYAGDANGDGRINGQDEGIMNTNFGKAGTLASGDVNGDGRVNGQDTGLVNTNFGKNSVTKQWK